ncbi:MAG: amidohydrolase family protein [Verrucomicrobiaceae bacterium]|nr:amidohydrolase family protein [Verrucomicrobiaceae bacterium]
MPGGGNWIDAHVHVWTPDTDRYPLAAGFTKAGMSPPSFTPEQLFAHCKPEGVARIVLIQMSYYQYDNRYMLDMMQAHPGVFSGVAIIDEHAADVRGRMKALKEAGVRGFRITPGKQPIDAWLGSPGMKEMWKVAADEGLNICALINPEALEAINKMADQFPETGLVIDHFARLGMAGPVLRGPLDRLLHLSKHSRAHVKTSAFYALGAKKAPYLDLGKMIKELRDAYGAERLMWASDCPFQVDPGHNYHDSIALVRDRLDFLTAHDKEWMLRRTAERVFFS